MAILGGGNPVGGSNPAGVGASLNYIGNHAFANSGIHLATAGSHTTMLEFTTGSEYIVAEIVFGNTTTSADHIEFEIQLNDQVMMAAIGDSIDGGYPLNSFQILIPSFTKCEITTINASGGADREVFVSISGRVYQ